MPAVFEIGVRGDKRRKEQRHMRISAHSWRRWNLHGGGSACALVSVALKDSDMMLCSVWQCSASPMQRNPKRLGW